MDLEELEAGKNINKHHLKPFEVLLFQLKENVTKQIQRWTPKAKSNPQKKCKWEAGKN